MWFHKVFYIVVLFLTSSEPLLFSSDRQGWQLFPPLSHIIRTTVCRVYIQRGRALNVHVFGGMDLPKLYKLCTPEKHWQTVLVNAESLPREILPATSRKAGRPIGTVFVIVDLKGFGYV
jgi:hypothetical protein